jgi:hypothetical protein
MMKRKFKKREKKGDVSEIRGKRKRRIGRKKI